jgi:hypothetical protein
VIILKIFPLGCCSSKELGTKPIAQRCYQCPQRGRCSYQKLALFLYAIKIQEIACPKTNAVHLPIKVNLWQKKNWCC